jgi:methionyl-tRNA formyltransferase
MAGDRGTPQTEEGATWAPAFEDDYREIDWSRPAEEVHRQVRAWRWSFQPDTGPHTTLGGERVHVIRTSLTEPQEGAVARMEAADGPVWILESAPV